MNFLALATSKVATRSLNSIHIKVTITILGNVVAQVCKLYQVLSGKRDWGLEVRLKYKKVIPLHGFPCYRDAREVLKCGAMFPIAYRQQVTGNQKECGVKKGTS